MASQTATSRPSFKGLNGERSFWVAHKLAAQLDNGETLTLTLPEGVDKDALPVSVVAFTDATPAVRDADIGVITSHNRTTGATIITASGTSVAGSIVLVQYVTS